MNVIKTTITSLAIGAAAWTMGAADARAEWPERPITVVVMYGAGGGTDTVIRTIVQEMAKATGWKINVINKPGAVGGVATRYVLGKQDDGYTWMGAANYNKFVRVMGHSESQAWKDWQYMQAANSRATPMCPKQSPRLLVTSTSIIVSSPTASISSMGKPKLLRISPISSAERLVST